MTEVGDIYLTIFWWILGFLGVAWTVLAGAMVALRGQGGDTAGVASPEQDGSSAKGAGGRGRANSAFDVAWTVAPAVIVLLVAVPAVMGAAASEGMVEKASTDVTVPTVTAVEEANNPDDAGALISITEVETVVVCCESGRLRTTTEEDDLVN